MDPISISAIKPLIDSIVSKIVVPKLEKLATRIGLEYDKLLIPKGEHFSEYFYRTYKRYSTVNTLVFKNNQMSLKEIYIPLTLTIEKKHKNQNVKINSYPKTLADQYQRLLITDTAGMGKSTISKRMFLDVIDNSYGIPIFIELRRLSKEKSLISEIQQQLNSLSKEFNPKLMLEFIQMGGFIFFLDGYDEISLSERENVTRDLQDFITKASDNIYVLTSRPETALASFGDFQKATIEPLKKKEAFELLRKYDNQGETSKSLIGKLQSPEYQMIDDFLRNPLLVSLLFVAFDYKQTIPLKKHIFYRQVYDAHFDSHDLSKGDGYIHEKKSKLDIDDFDKVLRFIGFECIKQQKIEFSKDELLTIIGNAKDFCVGLTFNASDIFNDLLKSVPLFCQDGNYYKWAHKSLQEYFAAQFIFKDIKKNQDEILSAIYNGNNIEKYYNMLDLYYDIDIFGFRKNLLLPLLKEYRRDFGEKESMNDINIQKGLLFKRKPCLILSTNDSSFSDMIECIGKTDSQFILREGQRTENKKGYIYCFDSFVNDSQKRNLLNILYNKKANFISQYSHKPNLENVFVLEKNKPYIINAHIDNPINSYSLWQEINYLLARGHFFGNIYIEIDDCINEISKIEKEISMKENPSELLAGL
jgi:hypothetical protein